MPAPGPPSTPMQNGVSAWRCSASSASSRAPPSRSSGSARLPPSAANSGGGGAASRTATDLCGSGEATDRNVLSIVFTDRPLQSFAYAKPSTPDPTPRVRARAGRLCPARPPVTCRAPGRPPGPPSLCRARRHGCPSIRLPHAGPHQGLPRRQEGAGRTSTLSPSYPEASRSACSGLNGAGKSTLLQDPRRSRQGNHRRSLGGGGRAHRLSGAGAAA